MTETPDWLDWEARIARLLPVPGSPSTDRALLLDEVSMYARAAVREARRVGSVAPSIAERERAMAWLDRPVFVCGHHRSGTTLLNSLFDGHPELVVLPNEGTYFTSFRYAVRENPSPEDVDRFAADWISRFVDPNYEPHFRLGRAGPAGTPSVLFARRLLGWHSAQLGASPARAPFSLLLSLVAAFHDLVPTSGTPRLWVEKTPLNERQVERLAVFSDARFIQLVRHPAATLASLLPIYRETKQSHGGVAEHARSIGRSLRLALRNDRAFRERYLIVRYEDLVGDPAREMDRVRAFIGISSNPSLEVPTIVGVPARANSSFGLGDPGVISRSRATRILSPTEATLIGAFTASAARTLGYEVAAPPVLQRGFLRVREEVAHLSRSVRRRIGNVRVPSADR
jgi:hypothetical protein